MVKVNCEFNRTDSKSSGLSESTLLFGTRGTYMTLSCNMQSLGTNVMIISGLKPSILSQLLSWKHYRILFYAYKSKVVSRSYYIFFPLFVSMWRMRWYKTNLSEAHLHLMWEHLLRILTVNYSVIIFIIYV